MCKPHVHIVAFQHAAATVYGTYVSTVMTEEVKIIQCLAKSGEAVAQKDFMTNHSRGYIQFFAFLI